MDDADIDADDIGEYDNYEDTNQVMRKTLIWKNVNQIYDDIVAIDADDADIVEYDKFEDKN